MIRRYGLSLALLLVLMPFVNDRQPSSASDVSGDINGYVYSQNASGQQLPIRNASVYVVLAETYNHQNAPPPVARRVTGQNGFYTFLGILPGRYYVVVQAKGYHGTCWPRVVVIPNTFQRINLKLTTHRQLARCQYPGWPDDAIIF